MGNWLIKILGAALLVWLAVFLWPSDKTEELGGAAATSEEVSGQLAARADSSLSGELVPNSAADSKLTSNVQPIANAPTQPDKAPTQIDKAPPKLNEAQNKVLIQRFSAANQVLKSGDNNAAISQYQSLIKDYPHFVELYVNLAAAQADAGKLEEARLTLVQGTSANLSTRTLFQSINKLHGFMAARAYRNALETQGKESRWTAALKLPQALELATDFDQAQQVKTLNDRLNEQKNKQLALSSDGTATKDELDRLRAELKTAQQNLVATEAEREKALSGLQSELELQQQRRLIAERELSELQTQTANAQSDLVAKLRVDLSSAENMAQQAQDQLSELTTRNEQLNQQLLAVRSQLAAASEPVASSASVVAVENDPKPSEDAAQAVAQNINNKNVDEAAIELVTAWASAWSAQDVNGYVSFYQNNYTSSPSLTRQQWLDQREVRLTNKSFIQVKVSNFSVKQEATGFSVTFTQHYRSNTLDDTIRKTLLFAVPSSGNWADAKIVGERIDRA